MRSWSFINESFRYGSTVRCPLSTMSALYDVRFRDILLYMVWRRFKPFIWKHQRIRSPQSLTNLHARRRRQTRVITWKRSFIFHYKHIFTFILYINYVVLCLTLVLQRVVSQFVTLYLLAVALTWFTWFSEKDDLTFITIIIFRREIEPGSLWWKIWNSTAKQRCHR